MLLVLVPLIVKFFLLNIQMEPIGLKLITETSFLIAVVALGLEPGAVAIVLCVWAPLVALARVAMGVHYVSDIVAGAVVGIVIALIGLQIYEPLFQWVFNLIGFPLW